MKSNNKIIKVTCNVTGKVKQASQAVFKKRLERVQRILRSVNGQRPTVEEATNYLKANYVSLEGRKQNGVDFLNQPLQPKVSKKAPKTKKAKAPKKMTQSEREAAAKRNHEAITATSSLPTKEEIEANKLSNVENAVTAKWDEYATACRA